MRDPHKGMVLQGNQQAIAGRVRQAAPTQSGGFVTTGGSALGAPLKQFRTSMVTTFSHKNPGFWANPTGTHRTSVKR